MQDVLAGGAVELGQHDVAAQSLHQRAHGKLVVGPLDEVALPVPWNDARGHLACLIYGAGRSVKLRRSVLTWHASLVTVTVPDAGAYPAFEAEIKNTPLVSKAIAQLPAGSQGWL